MIPARAASTNAAELTVSELAGALKRTLEDAFGHVRIRGEISGYRGPHSSGHAYFCLKDRDARLDAVIWKTSFSRMRFKPQEGLEVVATGRITSFPGKSTYQIVIESLEPAGAGALMALLEDRRRTLAAEGLFAAERKRKPPYLPVVIGVITSPTGAVIRDILHRLEDRFPRHVIVWPVRVQGEGSAEEVARAIRGFNALPPGGPICRPDLLIVARGGGSLEDLWAFNEEIVVRAAAESAIALISAVGHETDTTLIDHAADLRAPTPTSAAEMAVPVRAELLARVRTLEGRGADAIRRILDGGRADWRSAARALPGPEALLGARRQRLDLATAALRPALNDNARVHEKRLLHASGLLARHTPHAELGKARARLDGMRDRPLREIRRALHDRRKQFDKVGAQHAAGGDKLGRPERERLAELTARLAAGCDTVARSERERVARAKERVGEIAHRAARALADHLQRRSARVDALQVLLASLGYRSVLQRGYALVRDGEGRPLARAAGVAAGQSIQIEFADGTRRAQIDGARPKRRPEPLAQSSLFDN
jgi:exodeoxyribonuclease VII large subunit